jgi:hypothetical protein
MAIGPHRRRVYRERRPIAMPHTAPTIALLRSDRWAMLGAAVAQGWLTIRLGRRIEPPAGWNARLDLLGDAGGLALCGAAIGALVVGGLILRESVRSRRGEATTPTASRAAVMTLGLGLLALSVALAGPLGVLSAVIAAMTATGAVFHVLAGRFIAPVGIITLALLMTLVMALPNPDLTFAFPLMLTLLHVTVVGATHERFAARRPLHRPADWAALGAGWVFWTLGLTVLMSARHAADAGALGHAPDLLRWSWVGPTITSAAFVPALVWAVRRPASRPVRSARLWLVGALGLIAHNAAWLAGVGDLVGAALLAATALPAIAAELVRVGWPGRLSGATPDGTPADR